MNYLNYKKQFPKSIKLFFEWVSKQNPDNYTLKYYVDNHYYYHFFSEYFGYDRNGQQTIFYIFSNKKYFQQLKSELVSHSLDENFCRFFEDDQILFGNYSDTKKEYIRIFVESESSFESVFFVLEILIENAYYDSK